MTGDRQALDRTLLLMRDDLTSEVGDRRLLDALLSTTVVFRADRANLQSPAAQTALLTSALLIARAGGQIYLDIPDVSIRGSQPPLVGTSLRSAMLDLGQDVIPGQAWSVGYPRRAADITIIIGDTPSRTAMGRTLTLSGSAWTGIMGSDAGIRWRIDAGPVGALAAAGLAAGEAYKVAMRRLRSGAVAINMFDELFEAVEDAFVEFAPEGTPLPPTFGDFDCISGGAITQAVLYTLARFDRAGNARVVEPETSDLTNLNRYSFLRRSRLGRNKAADLTEWLRDNLTVTPIEERYDDAFVSRHGSLRHYVLIGADHIPTRWLAQRAEPAWLGIGATSHYSAMASYHTPAVPCAQCLHPVDDLRVGFIPTVSFVSHWAGLSLATRFVLERAGVVTPAGRQYSYMTMLRPDYRSAIVHSPVAVRKDCQRDGVAALPARALDHVA